MPRSLARLRYRAPPVPINFSRIDASRPHLEALLERRVAAYVVRQSNPRHVKLQTVVNPKAKPQATGKHVPAPMKPYTLRDVVDPEGKARHGEIIYVFRNTKTNQIIYSLQELLDNHHLAQLPFIGKHSKPPVLRPDEWTPHCVVTFATPEQGHNAFRKLREFRKLHELAWEKTNPEFKSLDLKRRIKKIMDQRANMSADLAEVLRIQEAHGEKMSQAVEEQQQKAIDFLDKRWQQIDVLANAAVAKEKDADNVKWLEHQIRSLDFKLRMKHNQNEADQKRLQTAKSSLETRLRKVQYAQRKAEQFKNFQEDVAQRAAPANEAGAEAKLADLKEQARVLQEALENPDPTRSARDLAIDKDLLAQHHSDVVTLEQAFEAKAQAESRDHYIARSVLPRTLKKALPTPYTLEGVSVQWADMQDALYASGQWPDIIEHETLALNKVRGEVALLSAEEFEIETSNEVGQILQALRPEDQSYVVPQRYTAPVEEPEQKTDVFKYLPIRNPFKSATA
ncbi:transcriptional regulation of mitochondrial recombination-domain-containing protein [Pyrenochaeta sp. MPI-SDFR-AT-0127]|nr:transcriptional regulation of mitochondrial recombination-domain-containing protein [Pyrenochaeta sp. MPI-SDFR-AT-0127]